MEVRHGLQQLIELEVAAVLGAERHERIDERLGYSNGSRPRLLTTQVGDTPLGAELLQLPLLFQSVHWLVVGILDACRQPSTCSGNRPLSLQ